MLRSMRERMLSENAAVLPVPDCDCAIMFVGGLMRRSGSAFSWILEGFRKPMFLMPLSNSSFLSRHCQHTIACIQSHARGLQIQLFERLGREQRVVGVLLHVCERNLNVCLGLLQCGSILDWRSAVDLRLRKAIALRCFRRFGALGRCRGCSRLR